MRPPGRPRPEARRAQRQRETAALFRVAGLPAVAAQVATAPDRVRRLVWDERHQAAAAPLQRTLAELGRPAKPATTAELDRLAGTPLHGGILAFVEPPALREFDLGEARLWARRERLLLILDGVGNPHNLGAIARTAAFFGLPRLIVSDHPGQAGLSEAAYRVAEGGLSHLALYRAHSLSKLLPRLAPQWRVVATAPGRGRSLAELKGGPPIALVLGNEEEGLPKATLEACGETLSLAASGPIQSLNVSATAAILIHALAAA